MRWLLNENFIFQKQNFALGFLGVINKFAISALCSGQDIKHFKYLFTILRTSGIFCQLLILKY